MNEFDLLRQFGTQIGAEADPKVDVCARVIERISRRRARAIDPRLSLASIGACALTTLVIAAVWSTKPANDSLASLADATVIATGPDALRSVIDP